MTEEKLKRNHIDVDKIRFYPSDNGLYEYSGSTRKGFYLIKEGDDYRIIDEDSNSTWHWFEDFSELYE